MPYAALFPFTPNEIFLVWDGSLAGIQLLPSKQDLALEQRLSFLDVAFSLGNLQKA
jgi:hypothetical protein